MNKTLEFSTKYNAVHAKKYRDKHDSSLIRRISNWQEKKMALKALKIIGKSKIILDVPCGAGRFWPTILKYHKGDFWASDNSQDMINTALERVDEAVRDRINTFQASAFSMEIGDESVDCIFCMRLIHHIVKKEDRMELLKEFHRVTSEHLIISLWVDGNLQATRRKRLEVKRKKKKYVNRVVIPANEIEKEFTNAGFEVVKSLDMLKSVSMWRTYVLKKVKTRS